MPRRKASRKVRSKKRSFRRKSRRRSRASTSIQRTPFAADRQIVRLQTSATLAVTVAADGLWSYAILYANSCKDPLGAAGANKPRGFNQWDDFYNYYRVVGCSLSVTPIYGATVSASAANMNVVIFPSNVTTNQSTDKNLNSEQPYARQRFFNPYQGSPPVLKQYMSTSKIWGVSRTTVMADDNYSAAIASDPVNLWYWHVYIGPADQTATATSATLICKMTQYVVFEGRKQVSPST